ncbi:unnamed protein product [Pylaiella littoralis]
MALTAFVVVACGILGAASAIEVVTPMLGDMVVAQTTLTVEWDGTGNDNRFQIDLYYCGSMCMEDSCGDWVTALCPYGDDGCPDNEGDYDVVMPEPMNDAPGYGYKIGVAYAHDDSDSDCSDEFYLLPSEDAPDPAEATGPHIMVTSPASGDSAMAGEEYTVEFVYDDGFGSQVGRFAIDLYSSTGTGECGTYMYTICDKPTIGCRDTSGDYDVIIPEGTPSGMYSIRVGVFEEPEVFDCSDDFEVVGDTADGSMSYRF